MTRFEGLRARCPKGRRAKNGVARIRLAKAVALVVAVVCSAPCVDAVLALAAGSNASGGGAHALHMGAALAGADAFSSLDNVEAELAASERDLPADLAGELVVLPGAYNVRFSEASQVVGYSVAEGETEAFDELEAGMEQRGWKGVALGGVNGATFVKQGGGCGWALVTCTQVGETTSVVLRYVMQ